MPLIQHNFARGDVASCCAIKLGEQRDTTHGRGRFRFAYAPVRDEGDAIVAWATMASRLGGPMAAAMDKGVQRGLESGIGGRHIRAARALLDWSIQDLAVSSGVSFSTIRRLEDDGKSSTARTRRLAVAALRKAGVGFLLTEDNTIAVHLK